MGGVMRFSAIMQNQSTKAATALPTQLYPRFGLLGGINISGPTAIQDGLIGAATVHAASGQNYAQWTNYVPPNDGTLTMAVILRLTSTSGGFVCGSSTGGTTWAIMLSSGVPTFGIPFGTSASSGLPALQVGHAYFIACSTTSTTGSTTTSNKQTFVVRDLVTGITQTSQVATSVTLSAPTGGVQWGDAGGNNASSLGGYLAAMMFSNSFLTQQELRMWAQDPWSFWYPQSNNNLVTLILESLRGPLGGMPAGAQSYDLPWTWTPPDRSFGPNRSLDKPANPSSLLVGTKPFKQDDWPVPANYVPFRIDQNYAQWFNPTQMFSGNKPFKQDDWPLSQKYAAEPAQAHQVRQWTWNFNPGQMTTGTKPFLQTDWPLTSRVQYREYNYDQKSAAPFDQPKGAQVYDTPIPPFRPQFSADLGSTQWLNQGQKPFLQTEWPLTPPPFRPQFSYDRGTATFITVTVTLPRNQYEWPLPTPFARLNVSADLGSTPWLAFGQKPFAQTEWPLTPPLFRPDFTFMPPAPLWLAPVFMPRNLYEWPIPIPPFRPQVSSDQGSTIWLNLGTVPFKQIDWPIAPILPPFVAIEIVPNLAASDGGDKPLFQVDWPLPILTPFRDYGHVQGTFQGMLFTPPFPKNQYDWPLPIPQFRIDQTSAFTYNPTQMLTGKKPFAQTDWLVTPPYPRLPVSSYQIGGTFPGYMPTPVSTVKIEWLIRARRRGRR